VDLDLLRSNQVRQVLLLPVAVEVVVVDILQAVVGRQEAPVMLAM
jgi:hypothetical protein